MNIIIIDIVDSNYSMEGATERNPKSRRLDEAESFLCNLCASFDPIFADQDIQTYRTFHDFITDRPHTVLRENVRIY